MNAGRGTAPVVPAVKREGSPGDEGRAPEVGPADAPRASTRQRLAASLFWIVCSRGVVQALAFASTLVVARLLAPADFGLMAVSGAFLGVATLVAEMGLGVAIIQFRALTAAERNLCFWTTLGAATAAAAALSLAAPAIAVWFASPALAGVLRVVAWTLPVLAARIVPDGLLRKALDFEAIAKIEIVAALASIAVTLSLALSGAGVWALVGGALASAVAQTAGSFWWVRWWPGLRIGGERAGAILRFSAAALGARISWSLYQQSDAFVLGSVAGAAAVGPYSLAIDLATLPVAKISAVVCQIAGPVMAESQRDPVALRASLLQAVRLVAWTAFPICVGTSLVASQVVPALLGEAWAPAVPIIQLLGLYAALRSVATLLPPVLMARFRAGFLLRFNVALLAVMPLGFWLGAERAGAVGVAAAWVVLQPLTLAPLVRATLREIDLAARDLAAPLLPPLAATALMAAAVVAVRAGLGIGASSGVPGLLVVVAAGAAAYAAAALTLGGPVVGEALEMAGWVLRPSRVRAAGPPPEPLA